MTNLNVSMPEAMKEYIESEVKRGSYSTPSEFVRELVREFQRRKVLDNQDRLMQALASGEPITDDPALEAIHQKLQAAIEKKLLAAMQSPALDGKKVMAQLLKKSEARLKRTKAKGNTTSSSGKASGRTSKTSRSTLQRTLPHTSQ